jgi:hypothetical protein
MCIAPSCDNAATARGLCPAHRNRKKKHGDVRPATPIKRRPGTGYLNHGYRVVPVPPELRWLVGGATSAFEHRFVMAEMLGRPLTKDESVHHKDGTE